MKKLAKREILKKVTDDKGQEALRLMPNEMQVAIHELTDTVNTIIEEMEKGPVQASTEIPVPPKDEKTTPYKRGYAAGLADAEKAIRKLQK